MDLKNMRTIPSTNAFNSKDASKTIRSGGEREVLCQAQSRRKTSKSNLCG
jgi:hypothetical protein